VDLDDPRLAPFRALTRGPAGDIVVVEGELAVQRALAAAAPIETVLCTPSHAARLSIPPSVEVLVADERLIAQLAGFAFHRGVLAAMPRPHARFDPTMLPREHCTVVVAAGFADPANVGAVIRNAHAFGAALVVTDTDPYTRKAIRASAGHVFAQSVVHAGDLEPIVVALGQQMQVVAATASGSTSLADYRRPARVALLVGNEGRGLSPPLLDLADVRVRIPAAVSLNVASAAAILLWQLQSFN
jgi:tRNA G18 (ribose-2'-O)-methylase SpoU